MTDVDLLFARAVRHDIMGWRNGTLVEYHAFPSNALPGAHSWGAYHFNAACKDELDLFFDPHNHGYCHGIKYVSLAQLTRYKWRRSKVKHSHERRDAEDATALERVLASLEGAYCSTAPQSLP